MRISSDPDFEIAKEYTVQGLSLKLSDNPDQAGEDFDFETKPRDFVLENQQKHPEDYDVTEIIDPELRTEILSATREGRDVA